MLPGIHFAALLLLLSAAAMVAEPPVLVPASLTSSSQSAKSQPANWTGDFAPCMQKDELLKHDEMDLGVRISTSNRSLAKMFRRAMNFWGKVVDLHWHEEATSSCALQLVDGNHQILTNAIVARSQFTEWRDFQGWIAFDPSAPLTRTEMYVTAVHEIGHMLGLKHNPSEKSIMYYLDLEGPEVLDASDLSSLAQHHKLRITNLDAPVPVSSSSY